jgi:hypothetical protein
MLNDPIRTYTLWENYPIEFGWFGGTKEEIKSIDYGDPTKVQVVSSVLRGHVSMDWWGIVSASCTLYVDNREVWYWEWHTFGSDQSFNIDITSRVSSAGVHTFKYVIWSTSSEHFTLTVYVDYSYNQLESGYNPPTTITLISSTTSPNPQQTQFSAMISNMMQMMMVMMIMSMMMSAVSRMTRSR